MGKYCHHVLGIKRCLKSGKSSVKSSEYRYEYSCEVTQYVLVYVVSAAEMEISDWKLTVKNALEEYSRKYR